MTVFMWVFSGGHRQRNVAKGAHTLWIVYNLLKSLMFANRIAPSEGKGHTFESCRVRQRRLQRNSICRGRRSQAPPALACL